MTVLTNDVQRPNRGHMAVRDIARPLAGYTNFGAGNTAHRVYKGSIVVCDVSDTDGYFRAMPLSSSVAMVAGDIFGGVAVASQSVDSGNTADGSRKVTCAVDGVWAFPKGSVAQTDVGAPAYASDDATITTTSTDNLWVGDIAEVDDTFVWVDISRAAGRPNLSTFG